VVRVAAVSGVTAGRLLLFLVDLSTGSSTGAAHSMDASSIPASSPLYNLNIASVYPSFPTTSQVSRLAFSKQPNAEITMETKMKTRRSSLRRFRGLDATRNETRGAHAFNSELSMRQLELLSHDVTVILPAHVAPAAEVATAPITLIAVSMRDAVLLHSSHLGREVMEWPNGRPPEGVNSFFGSL